MLFSNEVTAQIRNLYQFRKHSSWIILAECWKINGKKEELDMLLKKFGKQKAATKGIKVA